MSEDTRDLIAIEQGVENFDGGLPVEDNDFHCERCGEPMEEESILCIDCREEDRQKWWDNLSPKQKDEIIRSAML